MSNKVHTTFRVDADIDKRLRGFCERKCRKKGAVINELLRKAMKADAKNFTSWAMKEETNGE